MTRGLAGRPSELTELNHALFLRLAGEIQGFCRDLHDESIEILCSPNLIANGHIRTMLSTSLSRNRKLDHGNASAASIGDDWGRFGVSLWETLRRAHPGPRGAPAWNKRLTWLNQARSGIAHSDQAKIDDASEDFALTLKTFTSSRRQFDRFAQALDKTTNAYLAEVTEASPWC